MTQKEKYFSKKNIESLEKETKPQNQNLNSPSREYMNMINNMIERFNNNNIEFSSIEEVNERNGILDSSI